jgi:hypothetical protein
MEARTAIPGAAVELHFSVGRARPLQYAAAPALVFELRIASGDSQPIRSIALDVQVQIAAGRRSYADGEKDRLYEVFGGPERWGTTVRTLPWLSATKVVTGFDAETVVELQVPCTYDFEVTAAKYLAALDDGEIPLEFLFSGTVFYAGPNGLLQAARIGWDREARYRLPVAVWRETMDRYFPASAWVRVSREMFDRLTAYRARNAMSWDDAFDTLLEGRDV